jgi:hypothetical protein
MVALFCFRALRPSEFWGIMGKGFSGFILSLEHVKTKSIKSNYSTLNPPVYRRPWL